MKSFVTFFLIGALSGFGDVALYYYLENRHSVEISAKNTEIVALKAENSTLAVRNRTLQATLNACAAKRPVFRPHRAASTSTPTVLGWPVHK